MSISSPFLDSVEPEESERPVFLCAVFWKRRKRLTTLFQIGAILILLLFAPVGRAICEDNPTPTITSVTPNIWIAGQTYNITIIGTGLQYSENGRYCGASTPSVNTTSSGFVDIYNISYVSATEITATVTPDAADPTQTACVVPTPYILFGPIRRSDQQAVSPTAEARGHPIATSIIR
jgi:hypothetical protein